MYNGIIFLIHRMFGSLIKNNQPSLGRKFSSILLALIINGVNIVLNSIAALRIAENEKESVIVSKLIHNYRVYI